MVYLYSENESTSVTHSDMDESHIVLSERSQMISLAQIQKQPKLNSVISRCTQRWLNYKEKQLMDTLVGSEEDLP